VTGKIKHATDGLTDAQRSFADEYLVDYNASAAYLRAGYKAHGKAVIVNACRLLAKPEIQTYLRVRQAAMFAKLEVTQTEVLHRVAMQGLGDIRSLFTEDGNLKPMHELTLDEQALIQGVEVFEEFEGKGEDRRSIGFTKKIKLIDRHAAAKTLGGHFGLFKTQVEHTGKGGGPIKTETTFVDMMLDAVNGAGTGLPPPKSDAPAG
jgi:phage terminase small subunit